MFANFDRYSAVSLLLCNGALSYHLLLFFLQSGAKLSFKTLMYSAEFIFVLTTFNDSVPLALKPTHTINEPPPKFLLENISGFSQVWPVHSVSIRPVQLKLLFVCKDGLSKIETKMTDKRICVEQTFFQSVCTLLRAYFLLSSLCDDVNFEHFCNFCLLIWLVLFKASFIVNRGH